MNKPFIDNYGKDYQFLIHKDLLIRRSDLSAAAEEIYFDGVGSRRPEEVVPETFKVRYTEHGSYLTVYFSFRTWAEYCVECYSRGHTTSGVCDCEHPWEGSLGDFKGYNLMEPCTQF